MSNSGFHTFVVSVVQALKPSLVLLVTCYTAPEKSGQNAP